MLDLSPVINPPEVLVICDDSHTRGESEVPARGVKCLKFAPFPRRDSDVIDRAGATDIAVFEFNPDRGQQTRVHRDGDRGETSYRVTPTEPVDQSRCCSSHRHSRNQFNHRVRLEPADRCPPVWGVLCGCTVVSESKPQCSLYPATAKYTTEHRSTQKSLLVNRILRYRVSSPPVPTLHCWKIVFSVLSTVYTVVQFCWVTSSASGRDR